MSVLQAYRDDGPLARMLGAIPGSGAGALPLVLLGALPLVAVLGLERRVGPATFIALMWFISLGGASAGRTLEGRLDWLVPIVLRVAEYGAILAITWFSDGDAVPAVYAALFAVSVHQYEIVYRIRHTGAPPPRWVGWAAGGWELRMVAVVICAEANLLAPASMWFAGAAGTLFVVESASVWIRRGATQEGAA